MVIGPVVQSRQIKRVSNADVADVAWSQDDSMIASVGLDSMIYIWDGYNFGMFIRLGALSALIRPFS